MEHQSAVSIGCHQSISMNGYRPKSFHKDQASGFTCLIFGFVFNVIRHAVVIDIKCSRLMIYSRRMNIVSDIHHNIVISDRKINIPFIACEIFKEDPFFRKSFPFDISVIPLERWYLFSYCQVYRKDDPCRATTNWHLNPGIQIRSRVFPFYPEP